MSDDEKIMTSVKIPKLPKDATSIDWGLNKLKLQTVCARRGCLPAFLSTPLPDLPAAESAAGLNADKTRAVKMNRSCMAVLMESFQDNKMAFLIAIDTIDKTKWPIGQAHVAMAEMEAEYERAGFQSEIDWDKLIEKIKMGVRDDPKKLFNALQRVKFLYLNTTNEIKDKEMIKLVIRKLPASIYASQIEIIKNRYAVKNQLTDADDMPYTFFRRGILDYFNELKNTEGSNNEVTLLNLFDPRANNRNGGGGGRDRRNGGGNGNGGGNNNGGNGNKTNPNKDKECYYCHKKGHLESQCFKKKNDMKNKFCSHCNTNGHTDDECWSLYPEKKENNKKRDSWLKNNNNNNRCNNNRHGGGNRNRTPEKIRLTQPVKIRRFKDEFGYTGEGIRKFKTPAKPGSVLADEAVGDQPATNKEHERYRSIAGITNHMVRWSRKDCQNAQREISQFLQKPTKACLAAQDRLTDFIVGTAERGYTIKPDNPGKWDGTRDYSFKIVGESDSEYAKHPSRRSVNSGATFLNGALICMWCRMMPVIALSTCEAELYSGVLEAMDMMFCYYLVTSLGLTVELPMILYMDNSTAVSLANNWSIGGQTRHMDVKQNYLRELKECGFICCLYKEGTKILPDINTKNLAIQPYWNLSSQFMSFK